MMLLRLFLLGCFAACASPPVAMAECATPAKPAQAASAQNDPAALSAGFWSEVKKTESSENYTKLKSMLSEMSSAAPPVVDPGKQRIVDVAIAKPAAAAKVMSATATSSDSVSTSALSTVVTMTTSPKMQQEAAALVEPEAKEQVETWRANLSTGVQGLPGIYLGDNAVANGGERQPAPVGYAPVSGGSTGCPTR